LRPGRELNHRGLETLTGLRTVQAFSQEGYEYRRYEQSSERTYRLSVKRQLLVMLADPLTEGLAAIVLVCFMFVALQGVLSLSVLITVIFMLYRLQPPIKNITHHLSQITSLSASVSTVLKFLQTEDKSYIRSGELPFLGLQQTLRFEGVSFLLRQPWTNGLETTGSEHSPR